MCLTDTARVAVHQDISGPDVVAFSLQLELLLDGRWRKVVRFDSAHGQPHRHVFYPDGREYREAMSLQNNNLAFTEAGKILAESFQGYCERYIAYRERMIQ
jgi:hypothetical protein